MPFNGSGTFSPAAGNPAVAGTTILSSLYNNTVNDIANGMSNAVTRDGQGVMGVQFKIVNGTTSIPGLGFNAETSTGIYLPGLTLGIALVSQGVEVARFKTSGSVLIGSTSDTGEKLQVNGSVKIAGDEVNLTNTGTVRIGITSTTDGADTGRIVISSNPDDDHVRGGWIGIGGNEAVTEPGTVHIAAGDSGYINLDGSVATTYGVNVGTALDVGTTLHVLGATTLTSLSVSGTTTLTGLTTFTGGIAQPLGIGGAANAGFILDVLSPSAADNKVAIRAASTYATTLSLASNGSTPGATSFDISRTSAGVAEIANRANTVMTFLTNNTERARIDNSGNLLIGTTAAGGRLTATDAGTSGAATTLAVFGTVAAAVAGTESRLFLTAGEGTARSTFIGGMNTGGANNAHAMTFGVSAPTAAPLERMRLTSSGLNIGNTDGATPLEVTSSSGARGITIRGRSADNVSGLDFYSNDGSTSYSYVQGRVNGDTRYGARTDSGFHAFYTGASLAERMRVNNTSLTTTVPINAGGLITGQSGTAAQAFATFDASGTLGTLSLRNGSTSRSGYMEFFDPGATRQGYIGYSQTTASTDAGTINYVGGVHAFNGAVQIATGGLRIGSSNLITRFESAEQTVPTAGGNASFAHGGTRVPDLVQCYLRCKTAELGYAVGDEVIFNLQNSNATRDFLIGANATNVFYRWDRAGGDLPALRNFSTGVWANITTGNWRVVFKAHWL